ncbi:MAG: ORF6N domain-containing protein [Elusimicrobia bacterium]|nr:ORF6N domain-containing protein [Elusimicrobiota bacterium]
MTEKTSLVPFGDVSKRIFLIRNQRVMIDSDLATLYGVTTFNLNKAVKRNIGRFPPDFMFQLTPDEYRALRFQIGILERGRHAKYLPRVFTEQGVSMLSSALRSERAVRVNIAIMRAFVRLRQMVSMNAELAAKLAELERKTEKHDESIRGLFQAIRKLMAPPAPSRPRIGFRPDP